MSHQELSSFEAKQLAAYLKASSALVPGAFSQLKLGQWLNALSRSSGFRDWNAMTAVAPDVPETAWGEWQKAFFGIAQIHIQGQAPSVHLSWFRNSIPESDSSRHEVANRLAHLCLRHAGDRFKGSDFSYSRPDYQRAPFFIKSSDYLKGPARKPWSESTPIVLQSTDKQTTIFLWWMAERYTMAEVYPEKTRCFSCQSLVFDDNGNPRYDWVYKTRNPESLTDLFIYGLTGIRRIPRSCYYVPDIPNGEGETFHPVIVLEGHKEGEKSTFNYGSLRHKAIEQTRALNARNGASELDVESIARTFSDYEEKAEDMEFDYFGSSPYDD